MANKENQYKKCCLNCEYWSVSSSVFWNIHGYCYKKYGAFTSAKFKCGHFEYTKALLKGMENDR